MVDISDYLPDGQLNLFENDKLLSYESPYDHFKDRYTLSDLFFLWANDMEISVVSRLSHITFGEDLYENGRIEIGKKGYLSDVVYYNRLNGRFRRYVICVDWEVGGRVFADYVQGLEPRHDSSDEEDDVDIIGLEELFSIHKIVPLKLNNNKERMIHDYSYDLFPEELEATFKKELNDLPF